ncbi:hypothetical protein FB565_002752 [Actinoplanes lutulentus]|uniref:Uncharacterized protein n=1 Tax=Actinoplanes lutulentus TaxID=1287878 RepID=A0A327YZX5_9ACTN|nr:hypothetical protein [Actinoplanes lutulentus]MBB2943039.1 hypothetical protein [Actinoplanes lutulentus]RAK26694.1 hypothetical protein B0I29_12683 [Actinoplanes lutulentus]
MEFDPLSSAEDLIRSSRDELRRALRLRPLPVAVLVGATTLPPPRLGGWETFNGAATCVRVDFGTIEPAGPWVSVETARWAGTQASGGPLRELLEHHMRLNGDRFSSVEWTGEDRTVTVDGRSVAGRRLRAGDHWWALRCSLRDVELSVVARDWDAAIEIRTLNQAEIDEMISVVPTPPTFVPPDPSAVTAPPPGEPHRLLVDEALRSARDQADWLADGGPPPRLSSNWAALWRATVRRQADLAGQPEVEAEKAVQSMVNQMTNLNHEASWFRDDEALRGRAVSETLLFGTGLGPNVPSRPAQLAWLRRQGLRPTDYARLEAISAAQTTWLDEWSIWASSV